LLKDPSTSIQFTSTQLSQYLNSRVRVAESNIFWRTHINKKDQYWPLNTIIKAHPGFSINTLFLKTTSSKQPNQGPLITDGRNSNEM
jgi:hypothetical protein